MLFESILPNAAPLDVPDHLVDAYIQRGFRPLRAEQPKQPRKRAPRKGDKDKE